MRRPRIAVALLVAAASISGLTTLLAHVRPAPDLATALLLFLVIVVAVALLGGMALGIATALASVPVIVWFLIEPLHSFHISRPELLSVASFLFVAIAVSVSIDLVRRRSAEAQRARDQAAELQISAEGDRLRTSILRAVSHDLRTPLASIKASATSLLQDDVDWSDEARREFLVTIDEETDRLDRIVGDLLDLSRLEAGVVRPDLSSVDVATAVHTAVAGIDATSTSITIDHPGNIVAAADGVMLERVIANLTANAVRHGEGSPVSIVVRREADRATIAIVDHGPGMQTARIAEAFEPFNRLGDRSAGTGLGLAVARGFVDAMGGDLELGPTPGGGLTATIRLAAVDTDVPAASPTGALATIR